MGYITPSWQGAHCPPSRLHDVNLAYRMCPLGSLSDTLAYMNHTRLRRELLYRHSHPVVVDNSHEGNTVNAHADTHQIVDTTQHLSNGPPLTYNEAHIGSLVVSRELSGHDGCINSLALNATGEFLLSGSDDLTLCLYETCEWTMRQRYRTMHRSNIFHAVFVPGSERRVLSCGLDGRTLVTDLETSQPYYKCRYFSMASSLATSPWWPDTAYVSYANGLIVRVDTRARSLENERISAGSPCLQEVTHVNALATHERWPFIIASATNSSKVYLHDVRMDFLGAFATIGIPSVLSCNGIGGLSFSQSGDWMAVNFRRHDVFAFPWLDTLHSTRVPESSALGDEDSDGFSTLLSMGSGSVPCVPVHGAIRMRGRRNAQTMFKEVIFMEDDNIVCSGGDCGNVFFWRRQDGKLLHSTPGDSDIVNVVLYNQHVGKLLTSGIDATSKVLESNGNIKKTMHGARSSSETRRSHEEELHGSSFLVMMLANLVNPQNLLSALSSETSVDSPTTNTTTSSESIDGSDSGNVGTIAAGEGEDDNDDDEDDDDDNNNDDDVEGREDEDEDEDEDDRGVAVLDDEWRGWSRSEAGYPNSATIVQEHCALLQFNLVLTLRESAPLVDLIHIMREVNSFSEKANTIVSSGTGSARTPVTLTTLSTQRPEAENDGSAAEGYSERDASSSSGRSNRDVEGFFFSMQGSDMSLSDATWPSSNGSSSSSSSSSGSGGNMNRATRGGHTVVEVGQPVWEAEEEEEEEGPVAVYRANGNDLLEMVLATPGLLSRATLLQKLHGAFYVAKRELYAAFRHWTMSNVGQVQIPQWDRCMWGLAAGTSRTEDIAWLTEFADEYGDNRNQRFSPRSDRAATARTTVAATGDGSPTVGGGRGGAAMRGVDLEGSNIGRHRVRCLLHIMDIILQGKEFLCETTQHRRRYWMFRCVLELCYAYYFMALGETDDAIERVNRLERYAEYRCITALGSVNSAYLLRHRSLNQRQQQQERISGDTPLFTEMSRMLDAVAFPPILVPLALQIRILVLSCKEGARTRAAAAAEEDEEEEGARQDSQRERRISLLVEEMRKRLDRHPNRKVRRKIIRMLHSIHVMV